MNHLPLPDFQRNALRTSLKNRTPDDLDECSALRLCELVTKQFPREFHYLEDAWVAGTIETGSCFIAHSDFRDYPIEKDWCFADQIASWRSLIDARIFPCASEIRAGITADYPPLIVRERIRGKYYVLDGQHRIITLLYHGFLVVRVHAYTGSLRV